MNVIDTVIVVPCFNEADRLDPAVFHRFIAESPSVRFLFVDDGSDDGTADVITQMAARTPTSLRALVLARNVGKAEAVRQGILAAVEPAHEYFGYWDADLATPLPAIERFRDLLLGSPELIGVMGSRWRHLGSRIDRKIFRHYLGRVFATIASMTLDMPVYDTQCGAKLFRSCEETQAAFATPFTDRWMFDVELIARLKVSRRRSNQPPIEEALIETPLEIWIDKGGSKVRMRHLAGMLAGLARLRRLYGRDLRSG